MKRASGAAVIASTATTLIALASPACAQAGGGGTGAALRDLATTLGALVVVCILAFVCLRVMKRLQVDGGARPGAELRFVRALPLGPRERLVVIEWRGETLLLGVTAGSVTVLDRGDGGSGPHEVDIDKRPDAAINPADLTRALLARVFTRRPRENPS